MEHVQSAPASSAEVTIEGLDYYLDVGASVVYTDGCNTKTVSNQLTAD